MAEVLDAGAINRIRLCRLWSEEHEQQKRGGFQVRFGGAPLAKVFYERRPGAG